PVVPAERHRYRDGPALDAVQVDHDRLDRRWFRFVHSGRRRHRLDLRHERGRLVGPQGHREEPVGEREASLQFLHLVEDRVVLAPPDEVQVPALRVERRAPVPPHRPGHRRGGTGPSSSNTTSVSRSLSSLAAAISPPPARCVSSRYRTPSGSPCWRTAPAQLPKLNALPRVVTASRVPSAARLTVSRYVSAGTNCRLRCDRELPSRTSSACRGSR